MIDTLAPTPALTAYKCQQWNARERKPCTATVIDAYAPAGGLVRRRCGVCGEWNLIRIAPDPNFQGGIRPA